MPKDLISTRFEDVKKAKALLEASVRKYVAYDIEKIYTADDLEYYDSLSFRFEKCAELTINFFRTLELYLFAVHTDTIRDRLLAIQKTGIINDIDFWMEARLLRNKIAHTYTPDELKDIYQEIKDKSKEIFETIDEIESYLAEQAKKEVKQSNNK